MARQSYTPEQKRHALELVAAHGLAEAHRRTGIVKSCLSRWATAAGIATLPGKTAAATEARRLTWQERRDALAEEWAGLAADSLRMARRAVKDAITAAEASMSPADMTKFATTAGIATDKALLLNGEATDRRAHTLDPLERVEEIRAGIAGRDELASRRRGAA